MKKHLLLITAMLFSVASAFAQDCDYSGTIGELQWCLKNETLTISGNGEMPDYYFQGEPWHEYRAYINTAVVEPGVTSIGSCAFSDCVNLTLITISGSVTSIGQGAFASCLSLVSITIPSGVTSIGMQVFDYCINLTSITVENASNHYTSENGVLFDKDKNTLICYPAGKTGAYVIPGSITSIEDYAFNYCANLTSIIIPGSVITIGNYAFASCTTLSAITIPSSVTTIGNRSFFYCTNLNSISISGSVTTIGYYAFAKCTDLTSITNLNPIPVTISSNVFEEVDKSKCTLEVPISSVSAYQNTDVWKEFNIVNVGIENIEATTVKIYPNPTAGMLRIESEDLRIENVVIYDVLGKIQRIENWKTENTIDISHFSAGIYFVKISTEAGEVTRKVVKE